MSGAQKFLHHSGNALRCLELTKDIALQRERGWLRAELGWDSDLQVSQLSNPICV